MKKQHEILLVGGLDACGRIGIFADRACVLALGFTPVTIASGIFMDAEEIAPIESTTLTRQLKVFVDVRKVRTAKTGLLATRENIEAISTFLEDSRDKLKNVVVDAYLEAENGAPLLSSTAISLLKMRLLPLATLAIVYLSEAERLAGFPVDSVDKMKEAAEAIRIFGPRAVLVRADHLVDADLVDILYDGKEHQFLFTKTAPAENLRRERDSFSAAVTAYLAKDYRIKEAIEAAKSMGQPKHFVGQGQPA